jgi:hypothetical protein
LHASAGHLETKNECEPPFSSPVPAVRLPPKVRLLWPGIAIVASFAITLAAQDIIGTWKGTLETPNGPQGSPQQQTLVWKFESGVAGLMVTSYRADGSELSVDGSLVLQGSNVTVSFPSEGSRYEGAEFKWRLHCRNLHSSDLATPETHPCKIHIVINPRHARAQQVATRYGLPNRPNRHNG